MSMQVDVTKDEELSARLSLAKEANAAARKSTFADYRSRRAQNTLRRQDAELANFGIYIGADDLANSPSSWAGLSWGIVEGFTKLMLLQGYSIGTVNNHLSTIKTYAKLAVKAGVIPQQDYAMIRMVNGYSHKEGQRIDEQREASGLQTRLGKKKADFYVLSQDQEVELKTNCKRNEQGKRDRVLLILLLDLGLRVSEVTDLRADNYNPETGMLEVYRRKTDTTTTFELMNGKLKTMREYFEAVESTGRLIKGSRKGGKL